MDRRSQQNHIRAARDWLGRAEDSLAREDDVQGDLKLMLARAELARVGQSHRSRALSQWGRRGAALLVALALAGGVLWGTRPAATEVEQPAAVSSSQGDVVPYTPTEEKRMDKVADKTAEALPAEPARQEPVQAAAPVRQSQAATEAQPSVAAPPVTPPAKMQLPDVEKQQLMQSAGKILRQ